LLAVHELAQRPVLRLDAELDPLLVGPLLERRAGEVHALVEAGAVGGVGQHDLLLVDVGVPREIGFTVPLGGLRLLVELVQCRTLALLVVPREDGVGVVLDGMDDLVDVLVADRQDRLEIVDVGPPDELFVRGHGP
jgi:hypothetical protein